MTTQLIQPTSTLHKETKVEKRISFTKIMVLTDFSKVSDLALQYAVALARQYDARIYLTHIVTRDSYQLAPVLAEISYQKCARQQSKAKRTSCFPARCSVFRTKSYFLRAACGPRWNA